MILFYFLDLPKERKRKKKEKRLVMLAGIVLIIHIVLGNTAIFQYQSSNTRRLSMCFCFLSAVFAILHLVSLAKSLPGCVLLFTATESGILCLISFRVGHVAVSEQGMFSHVVHSVALLPLSILADIYGHVWGFPCIRLCHRQMHLTPSTLCCGGRRNLA